MKNIIQLGFTEEYDKLFWCDKHIWDTNDSPPETVQRPTEVAAFKSLYRQSRYLKKHGLFINLSAQHVQAMALEYQALRTVPPPDNVNRWIADRMFAVMPSQVRSLLSECSLATMMRDVLGMPPLVIDWHAGTIQRGRRAA